METDKIIIRHDKKNKCFTGKPEINCELCYQFKTDRIMDIYRTFVDPALRGKGIAALLVVKAIEFARSQNCTIWPTCPYVVNYLKKHTEVHSILARGVNPENPGACRI